MHTLEPINIKILKLIKFVDEIYNTRNSKSKMATHDTTKLELFITRFHPEAGTRCTKERKLSILSRINFTRESKYRGL